MASSSSLCSFFLCFVLPTKPPSKTPSSPQLNFSPSSSRFCSQIQKFQNNLVPLAAQEDDHHSRSSSSPSCSNTLSEKLSSVIFPSLTYANTLFFKSAYNVQVVVDDDEPEERLLNRFRREVMKAGVIQECKRRRFFENRQEEKKRKAREAAKRKSRRRFQSRNSTKDKQDIRSPKKEDDDDNWDLPEGDIPY